MAGSAVVPLRDEVRVRYDPVTVEGRQNMALLAARPYHFRAKMHLIMLHRWLCRHHPTLAQLWRYCDYPLTYTTYLERRDGQHWYRLSVPVALFRDHRDGDFDNVLDEEHDVAVSDLRYEVLAWSSPNNLTTHVANSRPALVFLLRTLP